MNSQKTNPMITALCFLCGTMLTALLVLFFFFHAPLQEENKRLKRSLAYYDSACLQKQGSTSTYGGGELGKDFVNYDLRSWDSGKTWYAVKYNSETETLTILGEADTIYPNLLEHLEGMDALTDYVQKNGAIGSKPISKGEINLLEGAGFTVKQN